MYNLFSIEFHELHAFKHVCWAVRDTRGQTYVANVNTNAMEVCVTISWEQYKPCKAARRNLVLHSERGSLR